LWHRHSCLCSLPYGRISPSNFRAPHLARPLRQVGLVLPGAASFALFAKGAVLDFLLGFSKLVNRTILLGRFYYAFTI
jgi:hypothetical protein